MFTFCIIDIFSVPYFFAACNLFLYRFAGFPKYTQGVCRKDFFEDFCFSLKKDLTTGGAHCIIPLAKFK